MSIVLSTPPGLSIQGGSVPLVVEAAVKAERNGFPSVWCTEYYNQSAVVTLAAIASATSNIAMGSSIAWALGRTPLTLATDFRSLAEHSGRRVSMGLGTSNRLRFTQWHGIPEARPVARMKELIQLVRQIWNLHEQPVEHDGEFYRCHMPPDEMLSPVATGMRVLMAGGRLPLIRAAGAVADGLVGHPVATRTYVDEVVRPTLAEGARSTGRNEHVPISGLVICVISDDVAAARFTAALQLSVYAEHHSSDKAMEVAGFLDELAAIRNAYARRDLRGMAAAVSDRMLDTMAVFGTQEEARERYRAMFDSIYEQPLLYALDIGVSAGYVKDNLHAICETFANTDK